MDSGGEGGEKGYVSNGGVSGEFVVNVVSEDIVQQVNICSSEFPPEVDEFEASGLTPIPSDIVTPPRVKESRINMECRLVQVVHVSTKQLGGSLVLGEVVRFHVDEAVFENDRIDPDKLPPIAPISAATYPPPTHRSTLARPT